MEKIRKDEIPDNIEYVYITKEDWNNRIYYNDYVLYNTIMYDHDYLLADKILDKIIESKDSLSHIDNYNGYDLLYALVHELDNEYDETKRAQILHLFEKILPLDQINLLRQRKEGRGGNIVHFIIPLFPRCKEMLKLVMNTRYKSELLEGKNNSFEIPLELAKVNKEYLEEIKIYLLSK